MGVIHFVWAALENLAFLWVLFDIISLIMMARGKTEGYKRARRGCAALKPFALVGAMLTVTNTLFNLFGSWNDFPVWFRLVVALFWVKITLDIYRSHDDDDYWKKKRKKLAAKIKRVAGRLVVVPVPAPSTG